MKKVGRREIILPALHHGQQIVKSHAARFKSLHCGRRWGKTQLGSAVATEKCLQGGRVRWVAPTFDICKEGWRKVESLAGQLPFVTLKESALEIKFQGGGFFDMRSADGKKSVRGAGLDLLIVDETQHIETSLWQEALRASLSDRRGGAYFFGTPLGRFGLLWDLSVKGADPKQPQYADFRMPTSSNPFIHPDEIAEAKADLPDWVFEQEYLGMFVSFQGKVYKLFDPTGPMTYLDAEERSYVDHFGAIDFGFTNPTAIGIAGRTATGALDFREEVYESGLLPEQLIAEVKRLHQKYGVRMWWGDPADPKAIASIAAAGIPIAGAPRADGPSDSWIKNGIMAVDTMLKAGDLRFHREKCPCVIHDFDSYRYPKGRENAPEKETPLKVDDHGCDMVRYMVVGLEDYYASTIAPVFAGKRSTY